MFEIFLTRDSRAYRENIEQNLCNPFFFDGVYFYRIESTIVELTGYRRYALSKDIGVHIHKRRNMIGSITGEWIRTLLVCVCD